MSVMANGSGLEIVKDYVMMHDERVQVGVRHLVTKARSMKISIVRTSAARLNTVVTYCFPASHEVIIGMFLRISDSDVSEFRGIFAFVATEITVLMQVGLGNGWLHCYWIMRIMLTINSRMDDDAMPGRFKYSSAGSDSYYSYTGRVNHGEKARRRAKQEKAWNRSRLSVLWTYNYP